MSELKKTILGIDPGSRYVGVAALSFSLSNGWSSEYLETINLNKEKTLAKRLGLLSVLLNEIYKEIQPQRTVVEKIFLGKSVSSAFTLGHARGVIISEAAKNNSEVIEYAAKTVKKGITGNGGASKQQVQLVLRSLFSIKSFETEDASDALSLALHGGRDWLVEERLSDNKIRSVNDCVY